MPDKQKQIPKEEAFGIFLAAFDRLGIEIEKELNGKYISVKLPRGSYKKLAEELVSVYHLDDDAGVFHNYSNYLKDRFNDIKNLLNAPYKEHFGYSVEKFQPLIDYASRKLATATSVTFPDKVVYSTNHFSLFNLWRKVKVGTLIKYQAHFVLDLGVQKLSFPHQFKKGFISLPPFHDQWLKVEVGADFFFLSVSDGLGKLSSVQSLDAFLSDSY